MLGTVTSLEMVWSTNADVKQSNPRKRKCKIYKPAHFEMLLAELMEQVEAASGQGTKIQRVFWATVPPVTVPPVTHGVGGRLDSDQGLGEPFYPDDHAHWYRRYFRYYTRPWILDRTFQPTEDPHLTGRQAVEIDRTIFAYNEILKKWVEKHNQERKAISRAEDWFIVDMHWVLERLAFRRYQEDPSVPPPPHWTPYEMPGDCLDLNLTTQFLAAKDGKRVAGGIFSLDGIHPTTVAYGIMAQEFINTMQQAGVKFYWGDGQTERIGPVRVDYKRLIKLDTLIRDLPQTMDDLWEKVVDGDQLLDLFQRAINFL